MAQEYFTDAELACSCCGVNGFKAQTRVRLNALREMYGKPIIISSGYRCKAHNAAKGYTQTHATGQAVDVAILGADAVELLELAIRLGFTGIGVSQKGASRFLHLDDLTKEQGPRPAIWSY